MASEYRVSWVGDQTREWSSQHGNFVDYRIALDGEEETLKLTQKVGSAAPSVGDALFGDILIEQATNRQTGEDFTIRKFKKAQRVDGNPPRKPNFSGHAPSAQAAVGSPEPQSPEWWYAKDQRIARAGVVQAIITGSKPPIGADPEGKIQTAYVAAVDKLTDAFLASLHAHAPHPSSPGDSGGPDADSPPPASTQQQGDGASLPQPASSPVAPSSEENILDYSNPGVGGGGDDIPFA